MSPKAYWSEKCFSVDFNGLQLRLPARACVSHFQTQLPQFRRSVSEGCWHPRPAAFFLSSEPHGQGLHALSTGGTCGSFQIASVSTLSMCSFSPDRCGGVADVSGGPPTALHPLPPRHAHIDTHTRARVRRAMCISWLCFSKQKIKKWEPLVQSAGTGFLN